MAKTRPARWRDSVFDIMLHLGQIEDMKNISAAACDASAGRRVAVSALLVLVLLVMAWLAVA